MKKSGLSDESAPAESPFAALAALRAALPPGPPAPTTATPAAAKAAPKGLAKGPAKAVVRLEKKGRGGKEVTLVEQLDLPPAELEAWLKDLKSRLGCGGALEDGALVLAGDLRKRLEPLLKARGVRQVRVG